ncbi:hypothetical protein EV361DRAFT_275204 [Lentinula raphanica]|nr:hypothetical protein EV361DRAFT_275204 [Lentinula raphanica]
MLITAMFPSEASRALVFLALALGLIIITHCLSRSTVDLWSMTKRRKLTCARISMVLAFATSWLFVFINQLMIFGISLQHNETSCRAASHLCSVLYGGSKVFFYLFLAEKVHIVWSPDRRRFSSLPYKICLFSLVLYCIPAVVLLYNTHHILRSSDGICVFHLMHHAVYFIVAYDIYVTILFTALFLWPLLEPSRRNAAIRQVTLRTLYASFIALTTSTTNGVTFAFLNGYELGWVCIIACSVDVIINSLTLFWVSQYGSKKDDSRDMVGPRSETRSHSSSIKFRSFLSIHHSNESDSPNFPRPPSVEIATLESALVSPRSLEGVTVADTTDRKFVAISSLAGYGTRSDDDSKEGDGEHTPTTCSSSRNLMRPRSEPESIICSEVIDEETPPEPGSVVFAAMPSLGSSDGEISGCVRDRPRSLVRSSPSLPVLIVRGRPADSAVSSGC